MDDAKDEHELDECVRCKALSLASTLHDEADGAVCTVCKTDGEDDAASRAHDRGLAGY